MTNSKEGLLDKECCKALNIIFLQTAPDSSDDIWDDAPNLFYDNKKMFQYNIIKLQSQGKLVSKLKDIHDCYQATKRDSDEANGLHTEFYLCE